MLLPIRLSMIAAAALALAACGEEVSRNSGERDVDLDRDAAFQRLTAEVRDPSWFTKVSEGIVARYEAEIDRSDSRWPSTMGRELRFAQTAKIVVDADEPREMVVTQHINDDELVSGLRLNLEELTGNRTRIHYEILPASGPRAKDFGAFVNSCLLAGTLADLGKLDPSRSDADKAEEEKARDRCTKAGDALPKDG